MEEDDKMQEPVRILHVFGKLNRGGAESRVMDLYRHMDRDKVQFDFLVHYKMTGEDRERLRGLKGEETAADVTGCGGKLSSEVLYRLRPEEDLDEKVRSLGGRIYVLPRFTGGNFIEYKEACRDFFAVHHEFAAVEGHMTSMASVYLPIAKAAGVPVTIAHARSAGVDRGLRGVMTRVFRSSLSGRCDVMMSCSREASVSVFGRRAYESGRIMNVPNALELSSFAFDPAKRKAVRERYGIPEDALVIGHVGRLDPVKNHTYIAAVGRELEHLGGRKNVYYLFAGKGSLKDEIQKAFEKAGLGERLIFTGQLEREETAGIYQGFDVFVFPSLYEGLPGTVIEAQASGLPCVIADTITQEVDLTELVKRLPLGEENAGKWAAEILHREESRDADGRDRNEVRRRASERAMAMLKEAGFDVTTAAVKMQRLYLGYAGAACGAAEQLQKER
jgi:glycosyltransferase involved in cell wall biosynthesis